MPTGTDAPAKTYTLPYPKERVSETIPKVMKGYCHWYSGWSIKASDTKSGHFLLRGGAGGTTGFCFELVIDVSGLDNKSCEVNVRCDVFTPFSDLGRGNTEVAAFFEKLNGTLAKDTMTKPPNTTETHSAHEQSNHGNC